MKYLKIKAISLLTAIGRDWNIYGQPYQFRCKIVRLLWKL